MGASKRAACRSTLQPDLPVVYGDRARLVEVVQNLIDNACKFMGDQPEPRITIGQQWNRSGWQADRVCARQRHWDRSAVSREGVWPVRQTRSQIGRHGHRVGVGQAHCGSAWRKNLGGVGGCASRCYLLFYLAGTALPIELKHCRPERVLRFLIRDVVTTGRVGSGRGLHVVDGSELCLVKIVQNLADIMR